MWFFFMQAVAGRGQTAHASCRKMPMQYIARTAQKCKKKDEKSGKAQGTFAGAAAHGTVRTQDSIISIPITLKKRPIRAK